MTRTLLTALLLTAPTVLAQPSGAPGTVPDPAAVERERLAGGTLASPALDTATRAKGEQVVARSLAWLRSQQDAATGAWGAAPAGSGAPTFPAISGLIVNAMLMEPGVDAKDPTVAKAVTWMLARQQPDGGIYDRLLPVYNTSIVLSALARVDSDEARAAITKGQDFLRKSQWGAPVTVNSPDQPRTAVGAEHPFYGGWGYGNRSRPDISNVQFALQALHDTGVGPDDEAFKRAVIFLQRLQMVEKGSDGKVINEMPYAKGSTQGGFIYATAENDQTIGKGQSFAGTVEETLSTGERKSMLRAYGSVSYAGFKSYLFAGLSKSDPRVTAVLDFCKRHYTVGENPNFGPEGQYYYYVAFARALAAAQVQTMEVAGKGDQPTRTVNWRADLINQLATMQNPDGSFKSVHARWMEDQPLLITAYATLAAQHALR